MDHNKTVDMSHRSEHDLILICVRAFIEKNPSELLDCSLLGIDWDYLIKTAKEQRVLPLVYWSLNAFCADSVPSVVLAQLKSEFESNAFHNLTMTGELFRILDLFKAHHIPAIAFKGPILAASLYGNIALRQFWDLDVLVHEEDFIRAKDLVLSLGYVPWLPRSDEEYEELLADEAAHDCRFSSGNSLSHLEIHWKVYSDIYPSRLETQELFRRAEPLLIFRHEVLCFSPEDMLLFFSHHGTNHQWTRILWICDVASLIKTKAIDWQYVLEFARNTGMETALNMGILIAHDLLKASVPQEVIENAKHDKTAISFSNEIERKIFRREIPGFIPSWIFHFRTMKRTPDQLRHLAHIAKTIVLPNQADREFIRIPNCLFFAYFLIRPIRLTRAYLSGSSSNELWSKNR